MLHYKNPDTAKGVYLRDLDGVDIDIADIITGCLDINFHDRLAMYELTMMVNRHLDGLDFHYEEERELLFRQHSQKTGNLRPLNNNLSNITNNLQQTPANATPTNANQLSNPITFSPCAKKNEASSSGVSKFKKS